MTTDSESVYDSYGATSAKQVSTSSYLHWRVPLAWGFLALVLSVILAAGNSSCAQTTLGQPIISNPGLTGGTTPSPIYLDATQFSGGINNDACLQISNAITQMVKTTAGTHNGVVDARGLIGDQPCATNMFTVSGQNAPPATGKLLLGNVVLHVSVTQVQPSLFQVEGTGWGIAGSPSNTIVRACTSSDSTSLCPSGALSGSPPLVWCWGQGGTCSSSSNTGISFGSLTQYMTFDFKNGYRFNLCDALR